MIDCLALKFICRSLSVHCTPEIIADYRCRLCQEHLSWQAIIHTADCFLVTPALWKTIASRKWDALLPEEPRHYLSALHALNLRRNTHLRQQAREAIGALNAVGIKPLLFKGAAQLFKPLHADLGCRIMTDLDILIPTGRIAGALNAMKVLGYFEKPVSYDARKLHHCAPLVRFGDYGSIELHRQVLDNNVCSALSADAIWRAAESVAAGSVAFYLPCPTHEVLIGMLHSQVGHRDYFQCRFDLRQLLDLTATVSRYGTQINWPVVQHHMNYGGYKKVLDAHLLAANRLFGMPLPSGIRPGAWAFVYYSACLAAVRWRLVNRLTHRLDDLSEYRIRRRYDCKKGLLPLTHCRLRYLARYCMKRISRRNLNFNTRRNIPAETFQRRRP